ncbi:MAG: ABC transporter substrate-binding protein [Thermoleophilaceae bacterium]|nr:ABC transporter substrate-binding protein [Thermoleophilaceae bacterium]
MHRRAKAAIAAALLALGLGGCLGGGDDAPEAPRGVLTVYMSLPARGLSADEARAVDAGARLAFRRADGHAGPHVVRLIRLDSTRAEGELWDPGQVQANAERAKDDPSAVAYIGEFGLGASAISVPVTNDAGLLQISPLESLTSLTREPPGRAGRGAPERYYPTGRRNFMRLVPTDLREVDLITARAGTLGARRVGLVAGEGVYAEELASQLVERLRGAGHTLVAADDLTDDPTAPRARAAQLAEQRPDAIVYAGLGDRSAERLLAALADLLPSTPVLVGSGVLYRTPLRFPRAPERVEAFSPIGPVSGDGPAARRVLRAVAARYGAAAARPEALYGYAAAEIALGAVATGGGRRAAVVRAAFTGGTPPSPLGRLRVTRVGDAEDAPMTLYRLEEGVFRPVANAG